MTHYTDHVTKVHIDDFINYHVVGCNKLTTNQFVWFVDKLSLWKNKVKLKESQHGLCANPISLPNLLSYFGPLLNRC